MSEVPLYAAPRFVRWVEKKSSPPPRSSIYTTKTALVRPA